MKQDVTVKFAEHLIYSAGGYSYQRPLVPLVPPCDIKVAIQNGNVA